MIPFGNDWYLYSFSQHSTSRILGFIINTNFISEVGLPLFT